MKYFQFIILLCFSISLWSQQQDSVTDLSKINRYIRFDYDNDFFNAADNYYTQGITLELIVPAMRRSPFSRLLIPLKKGSQNYYGLNITQECFTPGSIRYDSIHANDRPYAATMYLSQQLTSLQPKKNRRLTSRIDLGFIGPCALCEWGQKAIHKTFNYIPPMGWENQLSFDVVLNYLVMLEQGLIVSKHFEFTGLAGAQLGTLYTNMSAGLLMRTGLITPYFKQLGAIKKPVRTKFQYYIFFRGLAKAVGYNATLQGGLFSTDITSLPDASVTRIVYSGAVGIVFGYRFFTIELSRVYISPEFNNGTDAGWGHVKLEFSF